MSTPVLRLVDTKVSTAASSSAERASPSIFLPKILSSCKRVSSTLLPSSRSFNRSSNSRHRLCSRRRLSLKACNSRSSSSDRNSLCCQRSNKIRSRNNNSSIFSPLPCLSKRCSSSATSPDERLESPEKLSATIRLSSPDESCSHGWSDIKG